MLQHPIPSPAASKPFPQQPLAWLGTQRRTMYYSRQILIQTQVSHCSDQPIIYDAICSHLALH